MSTELPANYTEAELLYHYLGKRMSGSGRDTPLQELLSGSVQYHKELRDARDKLQHAEASSARGESEELDVEALIADVTRQVAAEGITN